LVLIDATYNAELGFSSRTIYMDQGKFLKVIYREHFAEWGKYEEKYPHDKIDKLDDTTSTTANVVLFGGNYTVADIAFTTLTEIIHNIPTFDLLGVPFDQEGCGYCSYWQHLNKDFSNRQKFKEAIINWYHKYKNNLVWVESNDFATCDCRGQHPNSGHYKLIIDKK
jgi:hypothetical protein